MYPSITRMDKVLATVITSSDEEAPIKLGQDAGIPSASVAESLPKQ
jgi:hypothetical protein